MGYYYTVHFQPDYDAVHVERSSLMPSGVSIESTMRVSVRLRGQFREALLKSEAVYPHTPFFFSYMLEWFACCLGVEFDLCS